jgi:signal transduction histidine kinase
VVRHAPGAPTTVAIAAESGQITVTVMNGRSPVTPDSASARVEDGTPTSGFGLVGMRERVLLDGGALETGPTAEGGFRVHAVLPIDDRSHIDAEESP